MCGGEAEAERERAGEPRTCPPPALEPPLLPLRESPEYAEDCEPEEEREHEEDREREQDREREWERDREEELEDAGDRRPPSLELLPLPVPSSDAEWSGISEPVPRSTCATRALQARRAMATRAS